MKKKVAKKGQLKAKGIFRTAGEILGSIGHELVEGKEKVVEMPQTVIDGIKASIAPGKKKSTAKKVKKAAKKSIAKKIARKAAKK